MDPSPIQSDKWTEIKNITNNFGPNFVTRELFSRHHSRQILAKEIGKLAVMLRWLLNLSKWPKSGDFTVFKVISQKV